MNLINRTIVVMLLLFGLVFSCASIFAIIFLRPALMPRIETSLAAFGTEQLGIPQLFCIGMAILGFAISALLLYLELMPSGKQRMHLKSIQGADVLMSSDAITSQLQYALDPLPGVIRAKPKVFRGSGDSVDVMVELTTTPDVNVKNKTDEVMDITRTVLEGGLGLRVGKVQIKLEQMQAPRNPSPTMPALDLPRLVSTKQEQANENAAKS